jgi:hypothetical protein
MAIAHQNISIGEATAALAAEQAQNAWRDALIGHASGAWTLEEEFDAGATIHWVVIKNSNSISLAGSDFYVCIGREIATGIMGCFVGEEYTAAANLLTKFAPRCDNQGYILANNYFGTTSTDPATFTLSTSLPSTNGQPLMSAITAAATERLFTCVEKDYAVLNVNNTTMYVGAIVDLIVPKTGLVATPAIGCGDLLHGSQGRFFSITRHPIAAADAPVQVSGAHSMIPVSSGSYQDMVLLHNTAMLSAMYGFPDRYQGDRVAASEVLAIMLSSTEMGYSNPICRPDKMGALRGKFKGIRMTTGPLAAAAYDDIVVDGRKHIVMYAYANIDSNAPYQGFLRPYGQNTIVKPLFVMDTGIAA